MTFGRILAIACLISIGHAPHSVAQSLKPDEQKELLEKAKDWLVPQPKPGAALIKIFEFTSDSDFYALGFVDPERSERALVGFDHWDIADQQIKDVPNPNEMPLDDVCSSSPFADAHGVNFGLITGIQLIRQGNEKVGFALIEKSLGEDAGHPHSPFYSPEDEPPIRMLARSCLAAALNDITSPKPDYSNIKQRIERILADQPGLKSEATDWVIAGLKASIDHQSAPEGTIERLVDDYLLSGGVSGAMFGGSGEFNEAERTLIVKGFTAVPALLAQRHSIRFTNHLMQGFNNFPSYPMNAGQVADAYLQRLANSELESNWLDRQKGIVPADDAVLSWWKEASALGEEAYVKKYTIRLEEAKPRLSRELLLIAQERYPKLLPDIYREILKTPKPSWLVGEVIVRTGAIPEPQKIELLRAAIATNHQAHWNSALRELRKLNSSIADGYLLRLLESAPKTAKDEYWTDQDANLGRFVSDSADPRVWWAFNGLLDRADLGMRMELIDHLSPPHDAPAEILQSFHDVYLRFRDDETVRDVSSSSKLHGPGAGFPYDRITMRDFLHKHWADWLDLSMSPPNEGATPEEWANYRQAVALAIEKNRDSK